MQKMMFNDKYGLTEAVLNGRKYLTRRIAIFPKTCYGGIDEEKMVTWDCGGDEISINSKYKIGEVVAVAQSYSSVFNEMMQKDSDSDLYENFRHAIIHDSSAGWNNKMFVRADLMPHQIQITNIRLEKLQDISDEDCIAEGIYKGQCGSIETHFMDAYYFKGNIQPYCTPREAYAALIDRVSGKGTWESNPYVFVYEFKLIK
jgi:hypothetical protein